MEPLGNIWSHLDQFGLIWTNFVTTLIEEMKEKKTKKEKQSRRKRRKKRIRRKIRRRKKRREPGHDSWD